MKYKVKVLNSPFIPQTLLVTLWLLSFAFVFNSASASTLETVNKEVWQVFKSSLENSNADAFNAIHTEDVIRAWGDQIITGDDFRARNIKVFKNARMPDVTIDFAFENRAFTDDVVYDVGYYRQTLRRDGSERTSYGRFHVVIKKQDDGWKIAQDWDTTEINGEKVGAKHFDAAELLLLN